MDGAQGTVWSRLAANNATEINPEDRLYLHPLDVPEVTLIGFQLTDCENYQVWVRAMSDALLVKNKFCFVDESCTRDSVPDNQQFRWDRCNAIMKGWLTIIVAKDLTHKLIQSNSTTNIWNDLREWFSKVDGTKIFHLSHEIYLSKQETESIASFFGHLKILQDELKTMEEICLCPDCTNSPKVVVGQYKLKLFLMRLTTMFVQIF